MTLPTIFPGGEVTAFCMQSNAVGTIWIEAVGPFDPGTPIEKIQYAAIMACADAWDDSPEDITCIGLALGNIIIIHWDDTILE